jgi:NAD-dependent deacetylase
MTAAAAAIAEEIRATRGLVLVLTGAGISLASGIPTFRGSDPGAIWSRDITELATNRYFSEDPTGSWRWYRQRFLDLLGARPNPAHRSVAALERWLATRGRNVLLVTQNIDTLHEQAGSARLVKVHGSADRCRCANDDCRFGAIDSFALEAVDFEGFDRSPSLAAIPRCGECGSLVRPHVLWFDEFYTSHADYQWHLVEAAAERLGLLLCVGTSLAVGVTAFLQSAAARHGAPMFLVEPGARPEGSHSKLRHVRGKAETLLPDLMTCLNDSA